MTSSNPRQKLRELGSTGSGVAANDGFDGQLRCASLADLVQLECLSGASVSVQVQSSGRQGHLFFENGELVHAIAGNLGGEAAAIEILGWRTGTFGESSQPTPARRTVTLAWQQLLLVSAQRRDEQLRDAARSSEPMQSGSRLVPVSSMRPPAKPRPVEAHPVRAARLTVDGRVLGTHGDASELFAIGAYLKKLAELIGEDLGMDGFVHLELERATSTLAIRADRADSFVVLEAPTGTDLHSLPKLLAG